MEKDVGVEYSIMNACKNCKHWNKESIFAKQYKGDFGLCSKISSEELDPTVEAMSRCWSEGIGAELYTKETFSCKLFEAE